MISFSILFQIYSEHPLRTKAFYCDNNTFNATDISANLTASPFLNYSTSMKRYSTSTERSTDKITSTAVIKNYSEVEYMETEPYYDDAELYKKMHHYSEEFNEPNTALLSTILIFGTFLIAYFLRIFRNSKFLGRSVSRCTV